MKCEVRGNGFEVEGACGFFLFRALENSLGIFGPNFCFSRNYPQVTGVEVSFWRDRFFLKMKSDPSPPGCHLSRRVPHPSAVQPAGSFFFSRPRAPPSTCCFICFAAALKGGWMVTDFWDIGVQVGQSWSEQGWSGHFSILKNLFFCINRSFCGSFAVSILVPRFDPNSGPVPARDPCGGEVNK